MSPRNTQFGREDIIEAAFQLVREQGWGGFSVQAVAKAINASTMPIYSQFSNVRELEDAVCLKAFDLLRGRLREKITGDTWIDQAIIYIRFAQEEKYLYRCMWDGRNPELQKQCGRDLWLFIDEHLAGYPPFAGLSPLQYKMVRYTRSLMAQGLATSLNMDRRLLSETGISTEEFIRNASLAVLDGVKLRMAAHEDGGA